MDDLKEKYKNQDSDLLPNWNKPGVYSMGRDPLGMQAASVRLYTQLVPGITNVTNRIRYYSFYCWVVRQFEKLKHSDDEEKWKKFIRRAEAIYVLSCVTFSAEHSGGMAGSDWAREHTGSLSEVSFDFTKWTDSPGQSGQYLKAARGNFGQFYISSMIEVGMLVSTNSRIPLLSEDYGIPIAEAFEKGCPGSSKSLRDAITSGTINAEQAKLIALESNPGALKNSTEREYLKEFLLGLRQSDKSAYPRQASLWNCLNGLRLVGNRDIDAIRSLFYEQHFEDSKITSKHVENLNRWRAYQANELCHVALELILNDVSHEIDTHMGGVEPSIAVANVISRAFSKNDKHDSSLKMYADELKTSATLNQDCEAGTSIVRSLSDSQQRPNFEMVLEACNLICILFSRWKDSGEIFKALDPKANFNRSLAAVIQIMTRLEDRLTTEALSEVIRQFVISNHLHIAGNKLANSGTFTYRFLSEDGLLKDVRLTDYAFTTPRIFNLLWFAEDVGLIKNETLTPAGIEFLDAH